MSARILVAMSGGVDSSVAAALLAEAGREAIGVSMHLFAGRSRCCSLEDVDDARRVAERLGMRFYVANYVERFREEVMEAFADAYRAGRTPIPCTTCNKRFKFDYLLERARVFGCDEVATGHYARVARDEGGHLRLFRPTDRAKDQSYFLFELDAEQLARACFPLGELTKEAVRALARERGLGTAAKAESQEICFVPEGRYAEVVESLRPEAREDSGEIVGPAGELLGRHRGVHHFTVGQRKGLGIAAAGKLYVTRIDAAAGRVHVGGADALACREALLSRCAWSSGEPPPSDRLLRVQVRHRHEPVPARVEALPGERARVRFQEPVPAVAPGQAAVCYDESDRYLLGGGWIDEGRS